MEGNQFDSRITRLEERSKVTNRRLDDLEDKTKDITKFEMLVEMFKESNKESREANKELSNTMKEINTNLTGLNKEVGSLGNRVEKLEENESDNKVDLNKLFKNIFITAVTGVVLWMIYESLGIKK